jgi:hypothetical protein
MVTLYLILRILTSPALPDWHDGMTVTAIGGRVATLVIQAGPYEPRRRFVHMPLTDLPECARIVGGWSACGAIGWIPPNPPHCHRYIDGHALWCPDGPGIEVDANDVPVDHSPGYSDDNDDPDMYLYDR